MPGFGPRIVNIGFIMNVWALGQDFPLLSGFHLVSYHSTSSLLCHLVSEADTMGTRVAQIPRTQFHSTARSNKLLEMESKCSSLDAYLNPSRSAFSFNLVLVFDLLCSKRFSYPPTKYAVCTPSKLRVYV
jgi:hypothetical protein